MHPLTTGSIDRGMLPAKLFYFFYYAAAASLIPFLALYYDDIGLSGRQIGLLAGIQPLITLVGASFWSGVADLTRQHARTLTLAIGGSLFSILALSQATSFYGLLAIVFVFALFSAPIIPLVDSAVVGMLGERKEAYGKQRLWGAVGWGLAAPVVGQLIDRSGLGWPFASYILLMFGGLLVATRFSVRRARLRVGFRQGLRRLATNREWALFLLTILVGFMAHAFVTNFLFLYLKELGASGSLMGISLTVATVSELPVWFFSDRLLERWGTRGVLVFSLLARAAQVFAFSAMRTPWLVLPIQLLHGPAFSAMWAAGVAYASEIAPEGMGATAQGLFTGVGMGLRAALGAFVGGALYEGVGPSLMFRWGGVFSLIGLLLFVLGHQRRN